MDEDPSHDDHRQSIHWAMRNEMDLLTTLVLAKIHGPDAKGVIPSLDHDASRGVGRTDLVARGGKSHVR